VVHTRNDLKMQLKIIQARFYLSLNGVNPVRDWLMSLRADDRLVIGTDIARVEYGWPIGMPVCRPLGNGLFEVRSDLGGRRIARVLFCALNGEMILLHGFIKKTEKTPETDLKLAKTRQGKLNNE
jgi:phage-related protein